MLKKWGANGLLVEYEDMFPYDQDLSVLKSAYAYRYLLRKCIFRTLNAPENSLKKKVVANKTTCKVHELSFRPSTAKVQQTAADIR